MPSIERIGEAKMGRMIEQAAEGMALGMALAMLVAWLGLGEALLL